VQWKLRLLDTQCPTHGDSTLSTRWVVLAVRTSRFSQIVQLIFLLKPLNIDPLLRRLGLRQKAPRASFLRDLEEEILKWSRANM
jgi:hypothetical protein